MYQPDFTTRRSLAAIEEIIGIISDETNAARQSAAYLKWVAFQAKFHWYSWQNVMLLAFQAKQMGIPVSRVAGATKWKELGRRPTVEAWANRFWILAPNFRTITDEETGNEKQIIAGFRSAYVFDVSQTTGDELPSLAHRTPGDDEGLCDALEAEYERRGIPLYFLDSAQMSAKYGAGCNGVCTPTGVAILDDEPRTPGEIAATMAHELAHAILHFGPGENLDFDHDRSVAEIEAESVAACIMAAWGLPYKASAMYLASWGGDSKKITASMSRITGTVKEILENILPA